MKASMGRRRILALLPAAPWFISCAAGQLRQRGTAGPAARKRSSPEFLVYCRDAAGVGERLMALTSVHWDYMDRFAGQLIARGPTLTPDGEEHTGSVHVVSMASAAEAQRFAEEEPFRRAGLYAEVSVSRFENLLGRTMWDRPPASAPQLSTFLLARSPAVPLASDRLPTLHGAVRSQPDVWAFLGLLVSDDGNLCVGAAASADVASEPAERALRAILAPWGLERVPIVYHLHHPR